MRKRMNRPKRMDPPKGKDPPKGVGGEGHLEVPAIRMGSTDPSEGGGRGHQVLPAIRGGGGESVADESNWAMHELPPGKSVGVGRGTPGAFARSDAPSRAAQITVGTAQRIIGPAHEVLIGLSIPNDLSEAHRELFLEFRRSIEDLQQIIAGLRDENRRLSDESEELRKKLDDALPLWERAWETFVLKSAEGAGTSVGKGAVFTAGFVAGMIYSAFAAEPPGIPI